MARLSRRQTQTTRRRFSGMGGVRGTSDATYNRPGNYIGVVVRFEDGVSSVDDKPFQVLRAAILHVLPSQPFTNPDNGEIVPLHSPGEIPGNMMKEGGKFPLAHMANLKNTVQICAGITEADAETIAQKLVDAVAAGKSFEDDEELENYAIFEEELQQDSSFETALDCVWNQAIDYCLSEEQPLAGSIIQWHSWMQMKKDSRATAPDKLSSSDYYTKTVYQRLLTARELMEIDGIDERVVRRFIPDLDQRLADEAS